MTSYPAKFSSPRHCGSGDLMFLVTEGFDSAYSCLNPWRLLWLNPEARGEHLTSQLSWVVA